MIRVNKTVYIARGIDRTEPGRFNVVGMVQRALAELGCAVYDPGSAWFGRGDGLSATHICLVNEEARARAGLVVAIVSFDLVSTGVPAEIGASLAEGRPVVLILVPPRGDHEPGVVLQHWLNTLPTFETFKDGSLDPIRLAQFIDSQEW